tara:strand:- start:4873 stop:5238 length:366 start_codon:yes stop_codon:yes gene_type:complete
MSKTKEEKRTAQLRNQEVLIKLLSDFTEQNVVTNLELHHMLMRSGGSRFSFHMSYDDFLRLYNGREVIEASTGGLSIKILDISDEVSNLTVHAFCTVAPVKSFTHRRITLSTQYPKYVGGV